MASRAVIANAAIASVRRQKDRDRLYLPLRTGAEMVGRTAAPVSGKLGPADTSIGRRGPSSLAGKADAGSFRMSVTASSSELAVNFLIEMGLESTGQSVRLSLVQNWSN